jgi:hypothetical protein
MQKGTVLAEAAENLDMAAVARVAHKAILEEIYLVDAKVRRDDPLVLSSETLSLNHKCSTKILSFDGDKNIIPVLCNFGVAAFNKKTPDKIVMSIEASFCVSYVMRPILDFDYNDIEQFSKINPVYNVWSYWREFVQSMTMRMGFSVLTIPLLKIVPKKPIKNKKVKQQGAKSQSTRKKGNA